MPQLKQAVPKYRKHNASGQAIVTLAGQDKYLGKYGSQRSRDLYDRLIAEFLLRGRAPIHESSDSETKIVEVLAAFWNHAKTYYVKNEEPTKELDAFRVIIRDVQRLFGDDDVVDFGPNALKTMRQVWLDRGQKRTTINANVRRLVRIFSWATSEEMIPVQVVQALKTVSGWRKGRSPAPEPTPVAPVTESVIEQTLLELQPTVQDMVKLQRCSGMRPSEVCNLRLCDVNRSEDVWEYIPETHKNEHHARPRVIYLGPMAQEILKPYLVRNHQGFCFSPRTAVSEWLAEKSQRRKTPPTHGNGRGKNKKASPKHPPSSQYTVNSYRRAIHRACDRAFSPPPELARQTGETASQWHARLGENGVRLLKDWQSKHRWSPNRLRHTAATAIRREFGVEGAQVVLGHSVADVTQVYAERDSQKAREIMRRSG